MVDGKYDTYIKEKSELNRTLRNAIRYGLFN